MKKVNGKVERERETERGGDRERNRGKCER